MAVWSYVNTDQLDVAVCSAIWGKTEKKHLYFVVKKCPQRVWVGNASVSDLYCLTCSICGPIISLVLL